jgi:hypothetical protein
MVELYLHFPIRLYGVVHGHIYLFYYPFSRDVGEIFGGYTKLMARCVSFDDGNYPGPTQCSLAWVFVNESRERERERER